MSLRIVAHLPARIVARTRCARAKCARGALSKCTDQTRCQHKCRRRGPHRDAAARRALPSPPLLSMRWLAPPPPHVEMMAAGLVTVAHNSGGPKSDIILRPWNYETLSADDTCQPTGCLASTVDEYATAMYEIFKRKSDEIMCVRECGRSSTERFSDEEFVYSLKKILLSSSLFKLR